ncbi:hypothetical protein [Streptomyces sp. NPDC059991]|uniref:hypothetical protein n=1 Tax=unclassified Streptomyces TaxID=2593676 RepID=UPI0036BD654E
MYAGAPGVFACPVTETNVFDQPTVAAAASAGNDTTAYVGVGYAPHGAGIVTAVKAAQLVGTTSDPENPTAAVIKAKTPEQVAESNLQLTTPDVPLNSTLVQNVRVHAEDAGHLRLNSERTRDERDRDQEEVDGNLWFHEGDGAGGYAPRVQIGNGHPDNEPLL